MGLDKKYFNPQRYRVLWALILGLLTVSVAKAQPGFQDIFDRSDLVMLLIDPSSGAIVQGNPAASRFYGYSQQELESMAIQDINTLTSEQVAEEIALAKAESRNYFIFRHAAADGTIYTVEIHSYPFDFEDKKLLYATIVDITEQRDLQSALWHHQSQLEETLAVQKQQILEGSQLQVQILTGGSLLLLLLVGLLWQARRVAVTKEKTLDLQHRRLTDIIEGTHVGSWEWNMQTEEFIFNERWAEIVGYTTAELVPQTREVWKQLAHPDDLVRVMDLYNRHIKGETDRYEGEFRMRHKNGSWVWVLERAKVASRADDGSPLIVSGTQQDITERKKASEELRKLSRAIEFSSSAVIITDFDGVIEYVNPKFSETTGYSKAQAIGKNPDFLQSGDTPDTVYKEMWKSITAGKDWRGEAHNCKKDGSYYWARNSISPVQNADGEITHYVCIQDDITHELEFNEQLTFQASHDTLTGLINRLEFERRAKHLLAAERSENDYHALCFMDLDQFKIINDTCGHVAGDELLGQIARVFQSIARQSDTLARLGGDEFGILMENCTLEQSQRVAESLLEAIRGFHFSWEGQSFRIGISIGLVAITPAVRDLTDLMKQADAACYMAKDLGRNRIHVYHQDDSELVRRQGEMQWVSRINRALDEDRFCLYAQPIVSLGGNGEEHFEFLLRMLDEDGKIIPPGAFLPAAERYDLIGKLDAWVVKNAFSLIATHAEFFEQVHFASINLSGKSLTSPEFLEFIVTEIRKTGIQASKICFEVTETVAISNLSSATTFISILKEIGCYFALDDFGSGLSSFGYLKNLPVDYLKIDGMFVKDIVDDPIDRAMVKSINDVGQVMGMQTIAEFVENDAIKSILTDIGVNFAQGYGLGKPMPFDDLLNRHQLNRGVIDADVQTL